MALQLDLDETADEDTVRKALREGGVARRRAKKQQRKKRDREKPKPSDVFDIQCKNFGLPPYAREGMFAKKIGREWRFDFCWQQYMIAVEIEGLVVGILGGRLVVTGRHASITGFREDCEKYASATMLGWSVVRFEQQQVKNRYAIDMTMRILQARGWKPAHDLSVRLTESSEVFDFGGKGKVPF